MCGIAGIINLDGKPINHYLLKKMTRAIEHRGPDDEGHVLLSSTAKSQRLKTVEYKDPDEVKGVDLHGFNIGFGYRRLSIIDLSFAGNQPMSNEDGSVWIVFNGEFYNYIASFDENPIVGLTTVLFLRNRNICRKVS